MIGGNLDATFQVKLTTENEIGETVDNWADFITIKGWLDLTSGTSTHSHNTKTEESSHMFISDYNKTVRELFTDKCRCIIDKRVYNITFIDDPMELHDHLEIFLKYIGVASEY